MKEILLVIFLCVSAAKVKGQNTADKSIQKLIDCIGVYDYLQLTKSYEAMWVEPQHEAAFLKDFDSIVPNYINATSKYLLERYTSEEIKKLIEFYESPLGKKMVSNNKKQAKTFLDASNEWAEKILEIKGDQMMGKYRLEKE